MLVTLPLSEAVAAKAMLAGAMKQALWVGAVRLTVGGEPHDLTTHSVPFEFDGGAAAHCELLDGPTRDFNLMLRQGQARVERVAAPRSFHCGSATLVAAYAAGRAATLVCDGQRQELSPNTLAWRILDSDGQLELVATEALWMEVVT